MTIAEIAKNHRGRKFRRPTYSYTYKFDSGRLICDYEENGVFVDTHLTDASWIAADNWEFISMQMNFLEALKIASEKKVGFKRLQWIDWRYVVAECIARYQTIPSTHWTPSVVDMLATDWVVKDE